MLHCYIHILDSELSLEHWRDFPTDEKDKYRVQEEGGSDGDEGEEISPAVLTSSWQLLLCLWYAINCISVHKFHPGLYYVTLQTVSVNH